MRAPRILIQFTLGIIALFGGIAIYILFRNETIRICSWAINLFGLDTVLSLKEAVSGWHISNFAKYSLPDGLYCISYILIMDGIWRKSSMITKICAVSFIPAIAICHEILQGLGMVSGTFDWYDLLVYATPLAIYLFAVSQNVLIKIFQNQNISKFFKSTFLTKNHEKKVSVQ